MMAGVVDGEDVLLSIADPHGNVFPVAFVASKIAPFKVAGNIGQGLGAEQFGAEQLPGAKGKAEHIDEFRVVGMFIHLGIEWHHTILESGKLPGLEKAPRLLFAQ